MYTDTAFPCASTAVSLPLCTDTTFPCASAAVSLPLCTDTAFPSASTAVSLPLSLRFCYSSAPFGPTVSAIVALAVGAGAAAVALVEPPLPPAFGKRTLVPLVMYHCLSLLYSLPYISFALKRRQHGRSQQIPGA